MRHVAANLLWILILLGLAAIAVVERGKSDFAAPGPLAAETVVRIAKGDTIEDAAAALERAGALPDRTLWGLASGAWLFRVGMRYEGRAEDLKAAEYRIPPGASMPELIEIVTSGQGIQYAVTVPEGLTSWEVVRLLEAEPALTGTIDEIPPEGSLAPDTYFIDRGTERAALIDRMQRAQRRILNEVWAERQPDLPIVSPEEALILASIIEKETGRGDERREVASVFVNRLRRGMRLQTDPTAVYGAIEGEGALDRPPTAPELRAVNPWNTYQIDGLPQTPIANPGRASLEAAVDPAETPYLYFVADGTGGHAFAETLVEHNRNVAQWERFQRERDAAGTQQ